MTSFPRGRSWRSVDRPSTPHVPIPNLESRWLAQSFRLVSNLLADHVHRNDISFQPGDPPRQSPPITSNIAPLPIVSSRIDQFQLTSVRSALKRTERPAIQRLVSRLDRTEHNLFLFSPPFHGSAGRAATPNRIADSNRGEHKRVGCTR